MANAKRKCGGCGNRFRPEGQTFPGLVAWCSPECGYVVAQKRLPSVRKAQEREARAEHIAIKKERRGFYRKDLAWQHRQCKKSFNRMRVLQELEWFADRGMTPTCISCGKPEGGDIWSCGHFKTVGAQSCLRYDPMNTYLQHSVRCNKGLSGDIEGTKTTRGYKRGLSERFGPERAQEIIEYCESRTEAVKWDWQQLEADRKGWNAEIKRIENKLGMG